MSKIGKKAIKIPKTVKIKVENNIVAFEGPKGKANYTVPDRFNVTFKDDLLYVKRPSDSKEDKAFHGLIRSSLNNIAIGVSEGYKKDLEIVGVGYRAQIKGKALNLQLGFTHPIDYEIPEGITIETPTQNIIIIKGIDKHKVGQVASDIRSYYPPEPYKGKGIKYLNEVIRRKAGKAVA